MVAGGRNLCNEIRDLRHLLELLTGQEVTLVLISGHKVEEVEIELVCRELVIVRRDGKFKFVDIDCICEVIVECEDSLEGILRRNDS